MRITIDKLAGMRPALEPHLLQDNEAQIALNARLETGAVQGLPGFSVLKALTKPTAKTLWRYPATEEIDHWLEFTTRADVARSPVIGDVWDRIYWTDDVAAKYGPASIVLSGGSFPGAGYLLGVPAPTNLPNISSFTPGSGTNTEGRVYRETFVTAYDEEGPPGPPSAIQNVNPNNSVTVDTLTPVPGGNYNITKRRLYRASYAGADRSAWQLVVELPVATVSYVDTKAQTDLGTSLLTEGMVSPPAGAFGLRITEGGVAIVGKGREVYMSEPNLPHLFNPEYTQPLQFDFVAVATFGQCIVVLTTGDLYVANGVDPASMQLTRIDQSQPCLSYAGVAEGKGGVLYPGTEGLVAIGMDLVPNVVTKGLLTQEQWLAYNPSSFIASMQNGKYHAFFTRADTTRGVLVIDPTGKTAPLVEMTQVAGQPVNGAFHDKTSDTLYVARNGQIQRMEKSGSPQTYTWRSKRFVPQSPTAFTAFYIVGDDGTITFRAYANGVLRHTKVANTNAAYLLPKIGRKKRWSFEIEGTTKVTEIRVATSKPELFQ